MGFFDALQWLGESLDKPGAAVRGLAAGRPEQLMNLIPFSDTMGITDPKQRTYGRDLLEQYGLLNRNQEGLDWGDVAGFGVDVAMDPLNFIGLGMASRAGKAAKAVDATNDAIRGERAAVDAANKGIMAEREAILSANAASEAMRASGALPEELLPNAKKLYRFSKEGEVLPVPGRVKDYNRYVVDEMKENPEYFTLHQGALDEPLKLFKKQQRSLSDDQIEEIIDELDIHGEYLGADPFVHVEDGVLFGDEAKPRLPNGPVEQALDELVTMFGDFKGKYGVGHPVDMMDTMDYSRNYYKTNTGKALEKYFDDLIRDQRTEFSGVTGNSYLTDEYAEILADVSDPLHQQLKSHERIRDLFNLASGELDRTTGVMPHLSQSMYVAGDRAPASYVDISRALLEKVDTGEIPFGLGGGWSSGLTEDLKALDATGVNSPLFGRLRNEWVDRWGPAAGEILDLKKTGVINLDEARSYLPYVAPKLKEAPALTPYWSDFIDKPRRSRLPEWLMAGQNTLAPSGRY